ncbi:hypothetical protein [Paracoccus shanxieyensis]|uniref:Bbp19-like phage domain-containing protein n=1 Tax=Paracoccus shanxieyensis TaxID=2675752 RepID=A0A6L6IZQ9_9RHOB|nr:hypothetical protein [Paracoccus shanxieyensis]MTH65068.1 hypothetical protein [Paracoccus shanxieyensis]MTH88212.1 hypothetical protein [Paracoccus shanxieyensis]
MSIAELIATTRERNITEAWNRVLDSADGRLVVWSILERCSLFRQTHWGNDLDGFRAGQRDIGLIVLNERVFPHDVQTFPNMQMEHAALMERIERAAEQEAEKENPDE